jgi:predicted transglutaminase-like cysteine proteinase
MKTHIAKIFLTASSALLLMSAAQAQSSVPMGASTSAPIGWVQFCQTLPNECASQTLGAKTITLNERSWRQIVSINADVNAAIQPVSDQDQWGQPELWSYPTNGQGDCEDYVLEKRRRLVLAGFPVQSLLITVVRDLKGDGHAVLTVKTDRGDFVLDNQESKILAWRDTGYRFIKRQADDNPARWVSLGGVDTRIVAAQR